MESIFKDLGIFKLHSNNDPSLQQELQYGRYRIKDLDYTKYDLLQQNTNININSVVEEMKAQNPNNLAHTDVDNMNNINSIEEQNHVFQSLLSEYTYTLKLLNDESVNTSTTTTESTNLYGKVVQTDDANYTYVNNYGIAHKYSTEAWNANDNSCPTTYIKDNGALASLQSGDSMRIGQPCGVAGKNIKNSNTGETAWVDIQGIKHIYSDDTWNQRSNDCRDRDILVLNNQQYNAIPSGGAMTSTNDCTNSNIDPELYKSLKRLNRQLFNIAQEMVTEIDNLQISDSQLNSDLQQHRSDLNAYLDSLSDDRTAIKRMDNSYLTVSAQNEDSKLQFTAKKYQLMAWTLTGLAIGGITIYQLTKSKYN